MYDHRGRSNIVRRRVSCSPHPLLTHFETIRPTVAMRLSIRRVPTTFAITPFQIVALGEKKVAIGERCTI